MRRELHKFYVKARVGIAVKIYTTLLLGLSALVGAPFANAESAPLNLSLPDLTQSAPYPRPGMWDWLTSAPENLLGVGEFINPKKNYWWLLGIGVSSAVLIKYDQQIVDESQRFARRIGLISETRSGRETKTVIDWSVGEYDLPLLVPANANSIMYFFGDGLAHLGVIGGLLGYGIAHDDNRAISTASQTLEALLVTGIIVQVIKRSTGREAPFRATESGGKWQFFPNQMEYNRSVPKFDAFPSGHLATVTATMTVVAENYPEHTYVKPLGYTVMGLLGFAMLNNGVHWAGDYPLGYAIGYASAKVAIARNQKLRMASQNYSNKARGAQLILPYVSEHHVGVQLFKTFY